MNNRENHLKRKDKQRIRDCGIVKKTSCIYVIRVSEDKEDETEKAFQEIMIEIFPNLIKRYKPADLRGWVKPKQNKCKEI